MVLQTKTIFPQQRFVATIIELDGDWHGLLLHVVAVGRRLPPPPHNFNRRSILPDLQPREPEADNAH